MHPAHTFSRFVSFSLLASFAAFGCSASPDEASVDSDVESVSQGAAGIGPITGNTVVDLAKPAPKKVAVRAGVLTLDVAPVATLESRDGSPAFVLRGHTSRNIDEVSSFVFDDAFAEARLVSARTFEVLVRPGHELNTILSKLRLFLHVRAKSGAPNQYTGAILFAPRFKGGDGDGALKLDAAIAPVFVDDGTSNVHYRATARTTKQASALSLWADNNGDPTAVDHSRRAWTFDWTYESLADALNPTNIHARATFTDRSTASVNASVQIGVLELGLTSTSAEQAWPAAGCDAGVQQCVTNLAGKTDLSSCGSYRAVLACR